MKNKLTMEVIYMFLNLVEYTLIEDLEYCWDCSGEGFENPSFFDDEELLIPTLEVCTMSYKSIPQFLYGCYHSDPKIFAHNLDVMLSSRKDKRAQKALSDAIDGYYGVRVANNLERIILSRIPF